MKPALLTFDVFGTVIDWRSGLRADLKRHGVEMDDADFERVIDAQAAAEAGGFRPYREITAASLVKVFGLKADAADEIGANVGRWPPFDDSAGALRRLMELVPCAAMTNSDRAHGEQAQERLGLRLLDWLCAEEAGVYKPHPDFWQVMARRRGVVPGPAWWHVSAYADYDLEAARKIGLTTVFVSRPHSRRCPAAVVVSDLARLVPLVEVASA
jgi:2-haloalkanoic acid dehalogenase type II